MRLEQFSTACRVQFTADVFRCWTTILKARSTNLVRDYDNAWSVGQHWQKTSAPSSPAPLALASQLPLAIVKRGWSRQSRVSSAIEESDLDIYLYRIAAIPMTLSDLRLCASCLHLCAPANKRYDLVPDYQGYWAVTLCGWEGNRRPGIALAIHTLQTSVV